MKADTEKWKLVSSDSYSVKIDSRPEPSRYMKKKLLALIKEFPEQKNHPAIKRWKGF